MIMVLMLVSLINGSVNVMNHEQIMFILNFNLDIFGSSESLLFTKWTQARILLIQYTYLFKWLFNK